MIGILPRIRLIQLKRQIQDAGPGLLPVVLVFGLLIYYLNSFFMNESTAWWTAGGLWLFCAWIQIQRKDKGFIKRNMVRPLVQMYLEYIVIVSMASVFALCTAQWYVYPSLCIALSVVPLVEFSRKSKVRLKILSVIIPAEDFEWIGGWRRSFLILVPLYLGAIVFSWFQIVPLVLLWIMTMVIITFYDECEPLQILRMRNVKASHFLKRKTLRQLRLIYTLFLPICAVNLFFHPEHWLLIFLFILMQGALLVYAVALKYTNYFPGSKVLSNNMTLSFISMSSVLPYLFPLPFFTALEYFKRAKANLTYYLYD